MTVFGRQAGGAGKPWTAEERTQIPEIAAEGRVTA